MWVFLLLFLIVLLVDVTLTIVNVNACRSLRYILEVVSHPYYDSLNNAEFLFKMDHSDFLCVYIPLKALDRYFYKKEHLFFIMYC